MNNYEYFYKFSDFLREQYKYIEIINLQTEEDLRQDIRYLEMRIKELQEKANKKKQEKQGKIIRLRIAN